MSIIFLYLFVIFFFHALFCSLGFGLTTPVKFLIIAAIGLYFLVIFLKKRFNVSSIDFLARLLFFITVCELYVFLIGASLTSVSGNLLINSMLFPRKDLKEIGAYYSEEAMVNQRIDRLRDAGFLEITPKGSITLTYKGKALRGCFRVAKRIFH